MESFAVMVRSDYKQARGFGGVHASKTFTTEDTEVTEEHDFPVILCVPCGGEFRR